MGNRSGRHRAFAALVLSSTLGACATSTTASAPPPSSMGMEARNYRIYDTGAERYLEMDALADALSTADVIFFGEYHDDTVAHAVQHELIGSLGRSSLSAVLGLEMFGRDVQAAIDRYFGGEISESQFLAETRPWLNYERDYRPLVELSRELGWRLMATNMPQEIATAIGRDGLAALDSMSVQRRELAAEVIDCPEDAYWERFVGAMTGGDDTVGHTFSPDDIRLWRAYEAQCARDETMAETLVPFIGDGAVLHINGTFHSDYRLGVVPRLLRRAPSATVRVISAVPVDDLDDPPITSNLDRADFLVFTLRGANRSPP